LRRGLGCTPYCLEALQDDQTCGVLSLAFIKTMLFGRFLVSLPYLNSGGVVADNAAIAGRLIDRAVELADQLQVRYLELRHETAIEHPALGHRLTSKVHMRLALPNTADALMAAFPAKLRSQIRKGEKNGLTVAWGSEERLADFYAVFSRNMRDLGTPVYGKALFRAVVREFPGRAEFCVVSFGTQPVAAALLLHGQGVTEVPSASSLRRFNHTSANMLLYWRLLERAVQRGQAVFDFGRSSRDSSTYRFKEQWGASPESAEWQYYLRNGAVSDMRPDNPRYQRFIRLWQRLPVAVTRVIGPAIVRGIP